jgi:hypothetical protein
VTSFEVLQFAKTTDPGWVRREAALAQIDSCRRLLEKLTATIKAGYVPTDRLEEALAWSLVQLKRARTVQQAGIPEQ